MKIKNIIFLLTILLYVSIKAQVDTLVFKDSTQMVGELKSMEKGVATISTDYSDSDFKIEWNGISEIYTESTYLISIDDGTSYIGYIRSNDSANISIYQKDGNIISWNKSRIVFLNSVDKGFWDRISASIDIGYNIAKSNNQQQVNTRSTLGYKAEVWNLDASFNTLISSRDDVEDTKRTEGAVNYRYILPKNWYTLATVSLLSNTEQKLTLRRNTQIGVGHFLLRTNSAYWGLKIGANRNFENYSNESDVRNSWEGYLGSELDLFDMGDLSLVNTTIAYKNFTESNRWRLDFNIDFKYDLPYDLYVKLGASYNFDNQPAENAGKHDYVIQNGIGWEW